MAYDLLIKGGHVLDPGQNLDGRMDIGISNGRIAAIQADIPTSEAKRTLDVRGDNRYVVPGLIDLHTHVAHGATTAGVGMGCPSPDLAGVHSGATTVVDAGSVGVANVGVFAAHILPSAKTRVLVFANVGTHAHTTPGMADYNSLEEIDRKTIASCVEANPGLISGFKLRLVGPVAQQRGEEVVRLSKEITTEHKVPLMVHIGDGRAPDAKRASDTTRFLLKTFTEGDILTHLCTPNPGGVMDPNDAMNAVVPEVQEARANGVTLDPALGRGNFGFEIAKRQAQMGLHPDTMSSDVTGGGRNLGVGVLNSMSKFMEVGYSLSDVVKMATAGAAKALRMSDQLGALAVGREADISIIEVVDGNFKDTDTARQEFTFKKTLVPVQTVRAGEVFAPDWGPFPVGLAARERMTETMSGQRLFAELVHGYGITHVFLVPTILTPALAEMGTLSPPITRVTAHSEKAAAYMADGYARASRRPGIAMAQTVGAANLAAGLKDAWLAGSPVIAISGGSNANTRYRHAYQELRDDFSMFSEVTKFSARVERVDRLPDLFRQAVRAAVSGAPGPAHLELGGEQGSAVNDEGQFELLIEERYKQIPPFRPAADPSDVKAALELLSRAQRPVMVVGGGVTTSGAQQELLQLAERLNIPFVTSLNAKSGIPDTHPLNIGIVGSYSRASSNQVVHEADVVFFVGSHTGGQVTASWKIPRRGTSVIQLDIDPLELGHNYPNDVSLLGDARTVLRQLLEQAQPQQRGDWVERTQGLLAEWWTSQEEKLTSNAVPMRPERVCRELSEALPDDAIVVVDTGHSGMWTGQMLQLGESQTYIRAAGSLGWALPASLGVKCAQPDRPVLCFTGDGGFYYHATELETAARYGINAVVLVNNNFSLNQDWRPFNAAYANNQTEGFEMWQFSRETNFAKLAESLGCMGIVVEQPSELKPALAKAFGANRPVLLDVRTDITAMAPRAWTGEGDAPLKPGTGY